MTIRRASLAVLLLISLGFVETAMAEDDGSTRLRLLYRVPRQDLRIRVDDEVPGTIFEPQDDLDADLDAITPVIGLDIPTGWGLLRFDYTETRARGAKTLAFDLTFDGELYPKRAVVRSRTVYQEAEAALAIPLPLDDSFELTLDLGARFVRFESELRTDVFPWRVKDITSYVIPTIGLGADVFVFQKTYLFGSVRYLTFNVEDKDIFYLFKLFGGDVDASVFMREWRLGVRLEPVAWASLILEFRALRLRLKRRGGRYRQSLLGPALGISVRF